MRNEEVRFEVGHEEFDAVNCVVGLGLAFASIVKMVEVFGQEDVKVVW